MKNVKKRKYPKLMDLKGLITARGENYREMAKKTNMSSTAFSNKMNGFSVFDLTEANALALELDIPEDELSKYFFPNFNAFCNKSNGDFKRRERLNL